MGASVPSERGSASLLGCKCTSMYACHQFAQLFDTVLRFYYSNTVFIILLPTLFYVSCMEDE